MTLVFTSSIHDNCECPSTAQMGTYIIQTPGPGRPTFQSMWVPAILCSDMIPADRPGSSGTIPDSRAGPAVPGNLGSHLSKMCAKTLIFMYSTCSGNAMYNIHIFNVYLYLSGCSGRRGARFGCFAFWLQSWHLRSLFHTVWRCLFLLSGNFHRVAPFPIVRDALLLCPCRGRGRGEDMVLNI